MNLSIVAGLLIPFLGTTAGAACVFFLKKQIGGNIQRIFTGFAAGVMVAASRSEERRVGKECRSRWSPYH